MEWSARGASYDAPVEARPDAFAAVIARAVREANVRAEVAISDDIATPAVAGSLRSDGAHAASRTRLERKSMARRSSS